MPMVVAWFAAVKKDELLSQMWIRSFATKYAASRVRHFLLTLSLPLSYCTSLVILCKKAGYEIEERSLLTTSPCVLIWPLLASVY
jgi:hypothetical protein